MPPNDHVPEYVPGLAGVPAAASKICFIDGKHGVLEYRGHTIEVLAENCIFQEVAWLLLKGSLPTEDELNGFMKQLRSHRRLKFKIVDLMKCLPEGGHPMDALDASVAALGMFYPTGIVEDPQRRWESCIRLLAKVPTIVAAFSRIRRGDEPILPRDDIGHAANFLYMLTGHEADPLIAKVFDVCLTLHAEHSMNASTFAARVCASTLADPYSVVSSAIGTLAGPLHGGANEEVLTMLRSIPGGVKGVRKWAEERIARKEKIPGFGHREYKVKDPRAKILQKLAIQLFEKFGRTAIYDVACELEKVVNEHLGSKGVYANVDFYSGIVYEKMGIPPDLFTPIFAISRTAGWLAHWVEQVEDNRIFRPSQVYVGDRSREFLPRERRTPTT
jgi:citrate synthase